MKAAVKEYNIQVDYCACMVAILLARHQVDSSNANIVWSAVNLSEKLNLLPFSETANFYVDSDALQHGMSIFQRILNKRGLLIVPEGLEIQPVKDFFDLKAAQRVVKVKFLGYSSTPEDETASDLLDRIRSIRDELLRKSNYPESLHASPSSVFSDLYLPLIILQRAPVIVKDVVHDKRPKRVTRKSPKKLKIRSIQNNTVKLLKSMENNYGEKNVKFYLESALRTSSSKKRKFLYDTEISENESDLENQELFAVVDVQDDDRVLEAITKLTRKYIMYGDEDKNNVISLFEIVKGVVIERDHLLPNIIASTITAKILSEKKYYSSVKAKTILRWYLSKDKKNQLSGPKIETVFESEVWSNLMLCMFEKSEDPVSYLLDHFDILVISSLA